jgi:hypothetical protein
MNVHNMSESEIDRELVARYSRTSGSIQQKRQRLQRFLDFEDQKQRRRDSLNEARIEARDQDRDRDEAVRTLYIETDTEIERECCDSNCQCDAALALMSLRNGDNAEIIRLNRIVEALDRRITELEVADMPPLEPLQDSNPNWVYDEYASPQPWECTQFN